MSELGQPSGGATADEASAMADPAVTAGSLLRQMREAAGVHIAALATTMKVSVDKLEALEADRYDLFSDVVFMRALAAGICRLLKQDSAPVLALLPGAAPAPLHLDKGINASFKASAPRGNFGSAAEPPRSRLLGVAVVLLLAGALGVALWPQHLGLDGLWPRPDASTVAQEPVRPIDAPEEAATTEVAPAVALPTPDAAPVPPPAPAALSGQAEPAVAAGSAAAVLSPQALSSDAAQQPQATLVLRASAPSWVQVRGSGGAVVLQKTLAAGESAPVPGTPPWSVVIGKADVTEVVVRGKPLDLSAFARENVARFEVK